MFYGIWNYNVCVINLDARKWPRPAQDFRQHHHTTKLSPVFHIVFISEILLEILSFIQEIVFNMVVCEMEAIFSASVS